MENDKIRSKPELYQLLPSEYLLVARTVLPTTHDLWLWCKSVRVHKHENMSRRLLCTSQKRNKQIFIKKLVGWLYRSYVEFFLRYHHIYTKRMASNRVNAILSNGFHPLGLMEPHSPGEKDTLINFPRAFQQKPLT